MEIKAKKCSKLFANVRFAYILFYMVYIAGAITPIRLISDSNPLNALVYSLLAISGGILLFIDLLYQKTLFKSKNCGLLVLFVISLGISIVLNMKYGLTNNLKTFAWTCIQLFLFASIDTEQSSELHFKHIQVLTETFSAIWLIWSIWSLKLFLQQYFQVFQLQDVVSVTRMGFTEGRLFGVFTDPNYAAMGSFAAIVFSILNLNMRKCSILSKIYHYFQIVIQFCYICLSGSRTAQLSIIIVVALLSMLTTWTLFEKKIKSLFGRIIVVSIAGVLCGSIVIFLCGLTRDILSYAPSTYEKIVQKEEAIVLDESNSEEMQDGNVQSEVQDESVQNKMQDGNVQSEVQDEKELEKIDLTRPDIEQSEDFSNNRFQIWNDYAKVFATTPLFGTSPRNVLDYTKEKFDSLFILERQYAVHNTYFAILVYTGIIGASWIFLWMFLKIGEVLGYLIRRRNTKDKYYRVILILSSILGAYAIAAFPLQFLFFGNMIYDLLFWVLLGYVIGFIKMSEPERYGETLPYRLLMKICKKCFKM